MGRRRHAGWHAIAGTSPLDGLLQDIVQGRGLCGEHFDALVLVAVGDGLGDAEALAEAPEVRPVAEPGEEELRLLPAGQYMLVARFSLAEKTPESTPQPA
jgi:hypothetical protein